MSVMVNHKEITDEAIYAEMQYHPARSAEEAMAEAARALVIRELLLQKAAFLNLQGDEETMMDNLIAEVVQIPELDDDTLQRYYQNNKERLPTVDGQPPPFSTVQKAMSDYLLETSWTNALRTFIQSLIHEATLSGVTFDA